jgi:hypothetical protein
MDVSDSITCVECRGVARLVSFAPPDEGFSPGDIVTYVCEDCGHRLDLVLEEDESAERDG